MDSFGVYLHIPYCRSRCRYCDFYSSPGNRFVPDEYVQALIGACDVLLNKEYNGFIPRRPDTLYFGGGTPGLLTPEQVRRVIEKIDPVQGAEITLEANPGPESDEKMAGWKQAGVNRLSLGVQTACDESLKTLGRLHTAGQVRDSLQAAAKAGFANISGDIMMALPGYSREEFDETLDLLAGNGAVHLSAYLLKIEPESAFGKNPPSGVPSEDEAAEIYLYAAKRMEERGYRQYEISNFAKPGREGRHNLLYWDCQNYLGIGPAAHSSMGKRRFSIGPDLNGFIRGGAKLHEEGTLSAEDYMMLRLRLCAGLDEAAMERRFGKGLSRRQKAFFAQLCKQGLAAQEGRVYSLRPEGMLVQNSILARLLEA